VTSEILFLQRFCSKALPRICKEALRPICEYGIMLLACFHTHPHSPITLPQHLQGPKTRACSEGCTEELRANCTKVLCRSPGLVPGLHLVQEPLTA
jgi:hypothetical protein